MRRRLGRNGAGVAPLAACVRCYLVLLSLSESNVDLLSDNAVSTSMINELPQRDTTEQSFPFSVASQCGGSITSLSPRHHRMKIQCGVRTPTVSFIDANEGQNRRLLQIKLRFPFLQTKSPFQTGQISVARSHLISDADGADGRARGRCRIAHCPTESSTDLM